MPTLFDEIMASLNELKDQAEGKQTGVVIHTLTTDEAEKAEV